MINAKRMYYANRKGKDIRNGFRFNCWGATAYVLELDHKLTWLECYGMVDLLEDYTVIISEESIQRGDILAIYTKNKYGTYLEHTAVYLGRGRYFHKRGSNTSEITNLAGVIRIYGKQKIEYRRVKR